METTLLNKLIGTYVTLELLQPSHQKELRKTAEDPSQFKHFTYLAGGEYFDAQFKDALDKLALQQRIPFAVRRNHDHIIIGSTSFYDIVPKHQRLAIGHTWYIENARGTMVNPECKLLLLSHAFETLHYERVEFYVDARNIHSQGAVKKLGATFEGILRSHIPMPSEQNYRRDTAVFSIIRNEWDKVKASLLARLNLDKSPYIP